MFHWLRSTWGGGADLLASARPAAVKNWPLNIFIFFFEIISTLWRCNFHCFVNSFRRVVFQLI